MELARVMARASTTIPMRPWSADPESLSLEVAVTSIDTGEVSGQGEGDDERTDFFPVFRRGFEVGSSSTWMSTADSVEIDSSLDFLEARISTSPIDRRFAEVFLSLHGVSTSVKSEPGVDCLVPSSRIGDDERRVKGEERREGDSEHDLERDLEPEFDRFGVCGIDKAGGEMTGDVRMGSETVGTGFSSQVSEMSEWSDDMSSS